MTAQRTVYFVVYDENVTHRILVDHNFGSHIPVFSNGVELADFVASKTADTRINAQTDLEDFTPRYVRSTTLYGRSVGVHSEYTVLN